MLSFYDIEVLPRYDAIPMTQFFPRTYPKYDNIRMRSQASRRGRSFLSRVISRVVWILGCGVAGMAAIAVTHVSDNSNSASFTQSVSEQASIISQQPATTDVASFLDTRTRSPKAGDKWGGCNDARAMGTAPIYAGEPGYDVKMDGDGDGIACEPHY